MQIRMIPAKKIMAVIVRLSVSRAARHEAKAVTTPVLTHGVTTIALVTLDQEARPVMLITMLKRNLISSALISVNSFKQCATMNVVEMGTVPLSAWMTVKRILIVPRHAGPLKGVPIGMIMMKLMAVKRNVDVLGVMIGQSLTVTLSVTITNNS